MAKKKTEVVEEAIEQPKVDDTVEKIKVKKKPSMKKFSNAPDGVTKVDLSKPPKTKENEQPVDNTKTEEVKEEVIEETTDKEEVVEQTTQDNVTKVQVKDEQKEDTITKVNLNLQMTIAL